MASDGANRPRQPGQSPDEKELSDRLRRLGERLGPATDETTTGRSDGAAPGGSPSDLGKAMRLSSEFIAGIIAGGLLGWLADRLLGSSPWGMIVLLILGFLAGIWNVMRASGMLGSSLPGKK